MTLDAKELLDDLQCTMLILLNRNMHMTGCSSACICSPKRTCSKAKISIWDIVSFTIRVNPSKTQCLYMECKTVFVILCCLLTVHKKFMPCTYKYTNRKEILKIKENTSKKATYQGYAPWSKPIRLSSHKGSNKFFVKQLF